MSSLIVHPSLKPSDKELTALFSKWHPTHLLRNLSHADALRMSWLLERESDYVRSIVYLGNEWITQVTSLAFPIVRRVFGSLRFEIIDSDLTRLDTGLSYPLPLISEVERTNAYTGLDAEVDFCDRMANDIIAALGDGIIVGRIPLEFQQKDERMHVYTRAMFDSDPAV